MEEDGQENLCVEGSVTCIGTSIVVVLYSTHICAYFDVKFVGNDRKFENLNF